MLRSLETRCAFREWRWLETAWCAGEAWVRDRSPLWVNCFCRLVGCMLGVHKARSEWFIRNSVPWCRVPSLPAARPRTKMEASRGVGVSFAGWLALLSISLHVVLGDQKDARLETCPLPHQTQGDIPGLQPSPHHHRDGQGRPFPRHVPGSSQGMAPNIPSLLHTNPIQTLSSTYPWQGCRPERPAASFRAE